MFIKLLTSRQCDMGNVIKIKISRQYGQTVVNQTQTSRQNGQRNVIQILSLYDKKTVFRIQGNMVREIFIKF